MNEGHQYRSRGPRRDVNKTKPPERVWRTLFPDDTSRPPTDKEAKTSAPTSRGDRQEARVQRCALGLDQKHELGKQSLTAFRPPDSGP